MNPLKIYLEGEKKNQSLPRKRVGVHDILHQLNNTQVLRKSLTLVIMDSPVHDILMFVVKIKCKHLYYTHTRCIYPMQPHQNRPYGY